MPRGQPKKKTRTPPAKDAPTYLPLDPLGTGMPALDSIIGVKELRKGKKVYRLILTSEVDEYEPVAPKVKRKKG